MTISNHSLIILLIASQSSKVLFLGLYSFYKLLRNRSAGSTSAPSTHQSGSTPFCLADGFLITHSTSAADLAVLLIALHTLLTILRPRTHLDEGGLYPHRHLVYTLWLLYPTLTASLAFLNGTSAYLDQGSFCALPIRPFWFRLALQWVPRYLILSFIVAIYLSIYIYVVLKFRRTDEAHASTNSFSATDGSAVSATNPSSHGHHPQNVSLKKRHRAIKRQLRYMFIYPLVYATLWIIPFVSHCYGYTAKQTPFALSTTALVSSCLQCAGDCAVFWLREKPWRKTREEVVRIREAVREREKVRRESMGRKPSIWAGWGSLSSGEATLGEGPRVWGQGGVEGNGSNRSLVRAFTRFRIGGGTGREGARSRHWWDGEDVFGSRERGLNAGGVDGAAAAAGQQGEK